MENKAKKFDFCGHGLKKAAGVEAWKIVFLLSSKTPAQENSNRILNENLQDLFQKVGYVFCMSACKNSTTVKSMQRDSTFDTLTKFYRNIPVLI